MKEMRENEEKKGFVWIRILFCVNYGILFT